MEGILKMLFFIWISLRYKISVLQDTTRPHLHSDGLPRKSRRSFICT